MWQHNKIIRNNCETIEEIKDFSEKYAVQSAQIAICESIKAIYEIN
jgi:hypothetical protein